MGEIVYKSDDNFKNSLLIYEGNAPALEEPRTPTQDKIFIWSAVIAGCGIMALLGRHAAIHRFGTDHFTGNVLFAVFLVLSIGLYCGFLSAIEEVFNRLSTLFRRREVMAIRLLFYTTYGYTATSHLTISS